MRLLRLPSRTLGGKLAVLYAGLFALALALLGITAQALIRAHAGNSVQAELAASGSVYDGLWALRAKTLAGTADVLTRDDGQKIAVLAYTPSLAQVFVERLPNYAGAVLILMLAMLCASQLLIRFLLSQLNTLKDVMLHVEQTGDLSARVPLACTDEVGQMASAFNAMQAGYQRVVTTVANTARQLDVGAARLAAQAGLPSSCGSFV